MTPLEKTRAGQLVTMADKIKTLKTIEELEGFKAGLKFSALHVSDEDIALMARLRIELL